jgi:uncharacterized protein YjbI with pentapeptide repeats
MQFSPGWGEILFGKRTWIGRSSKLMMAVLALAALVLVGAAPAGATGCTPGPGAELAGCNFSGSSLYGVDLAGADLTGATLTGANLTDANLNQATLTSVIGTSADLQGATITDADLTNANFGSGLFDGANLQGSTIVDTQFTGSDLTGVQSGGVTGSGYTLPTNWSLAGGYLAGPNANLTNADLSTVDLTGADLGAAYLTGTNLTGTNLTGANLTGIITGGVTGTPSNLPDNWSLVNGYLVGPSAFLYGANLTNADLNSVDAAGANFEGANLTGADLTGANFTNVDGISSTFTGTILSSTSLSGSDLANVTSGGITGVPSSLPSSSWQLDSGYLVGPYADLANANLTDANLTNSNLLKANLSGANLTGADLMSSNLRITRLGGANLTNASFAKADVVGATLTGAKVSGAVFTSANLSGVSSGGLIGRPGPLPLGWRLDATYLVGPYANLIGANLQKANLSKADLQGANAIGANLKSSVLTGANLASAQLSQAALTGVVSGGIHGKPQSLPAGWGLEGGYLVGPGANLARANLQKANLSKTDLQGANAIGANLKSSTLTGANLASAQLSGAALAGVVSGGITGKPRSLPTGWELVKGVLRQIPKSNSKPAIETASKPETSSSAKASLLSESSHVSSAASPKTTTPPQYGIDVYTTDNCASPSVWQSEATNTMQGFKSLGANSVGITFPIFTPEATSNSVFTADLCNEPAATPVPLQSPSPARLAVLVHAAQVAGLHVLLRPEIQESNLSIAGYWRGTIAPTDKNVWFQSYRSVLKPYLQMAQANGVTRFDISIELVSLGSSSTQWKSTIAAAQQLYKGQLVFDSSWEAGGGVAYANTATAEDAYPDVAQATPTWSVSQLVAAWNANLKTVHFPAASTNVTIDEVGIYALDGAYAFPCCYSVPGATFDQTIQANWFSAACGFTKANKLAGIYFWGPYFGFNSGDLLTQPNSQSPAELQPAGQAAIRACFK